MNSRHRFFRNEYRSFNMTSSQISSEKSVRSQSHGLYHSDNNTGNLRRFHPKYFPPSRRNDLFVEAGRLAIEYLISHGLLPPNVLSLPSSSNGNSSKMNKDLRDPTPSSGKGRPEQDIIDNDEASGRRKSPDCCSPMRGDHVDGNGRDESSSLILKSNVNDLVDVGTDGDVSHSNQQQQRDGEDANTDNISKDEHAFKEKDEAVASGEKSDDVSASSKCEDGNNLFLTIKVNAPGDMTDTKCSSEFVASVQNNPHIDGSSSGISASEIHNSLGKDKGEKRALGDEDARDNTKKVKQWHSVSPVHENPQLSDPIFEKPFATGQEVRSLPGTFGIEAVNQEESLASVSLPSKSGAASAGPSAPYSEEKQFFPCSFKICDLNLMEASDNTNESLDDCTHAYSSISVPGKQVPLDVDLSMGNICALSNEYNKHKALDKAIDVIDLEGDSLHGDKSFHSSMKRAQSGFTGLENFSNHMQNSSYNPDAQDGYGLMISELIGNDIPNCPSVQPEINPLHNDMGLHHGDGILSDDDQIYMTLGEIPISLLRGWDQPPQDYEKSF